jgi:hypothetical protein
MKLSAMTPAPYHLTDLARRYPAAWYSQDPAAVASLFSPVASFRVNDTVKTSMAGIARVSPWLADLEHHRFFTPRGLSG